MARITDTERGARLAYDTASHALSELPLFPSLTLTPDAAVEWISILESSRAAVACVRTWDTLLDLYWMHQRRQRRARLRAAAQRRKQAHG